MRAQSTTTTPLSTPDRSELALIRGELAHALRATSPDTAALAQVLQRLDALIIAPCPAPSAGATAAAPSRWSPVARSLFAGW